MREFEHKRKIRKILSSPLVLLPLAIILFFLIRGTWNIYIKNRDSGIELRLAEERLARLEGRQSKLAAGIERLSTESGIEGEIRDRFQMAKDGERAIVIVEEPKKIADLPLPEKNFLQKIWNFFTIR
ncbi:MAG: septum formation initiator family protein [bacterium]|nr:septum formation initiator family protein [bacterium]